MLYLAVDKLDMNIGLSHSPGKEECGIGIGMGDYRAVVLQHCTDFSAGPVRCIGCRHDKFLSA